MINIRASEIRDESVEMLKEVHCIENIIMNNLGETASSILHLGFTISSSIATALCTISDDEFETNITRAQEGILTLNDEIVLLEQSRQYSSVDFELIFSKISHLQRALEDILIVCKINLSEQLSPKLEKACI